MTTGDEQPFDAVAAAEALLHYDNTGESMPTAEDLAAEHAEAERQAPLVAALAEKDVSIDLSPGQTLLDKSIAMTVEVENLREQWDNLAARQIAKGERPGDEERFDTLSARMDSALKQGERVDIAHYIDMITIDPDPAAKAEQLESTIAEISASAHLTPVEKRAYLEVLEGMVDQQDFSKAMEAIRTGSTLEQSLGRIAAETTNATASAEEFQAIQAALIHEFGVASINHEDWLSFSKRLHRVIELQRRDGPETQIMGRIGHLQLQEAAGRLGIPAEKLTQIFTRFGIEPPESY